MNQKDEEVSREIFQVDNLPKQFVPDAGTAYIIVISESNDGINRQINQPGEDKIEVFTQLNEQICIKEDIYINWE